MTKRTTQSQMLRYLRGLSTAALKRHFRLSTRAYTERLYKIKPAGRAS